MNENSRRYKIFSNLLNLSESKKWDEAILEWNVEEIFNEKENTCLCGHYPITEVIIIINKLNKKNAIIGNCCEVNIFHNKTYTKMFRAIKKKKINKALIEYAYNRNIINMWERNFASQLWRKKFLTIKQKPIFEKIKAKILKEVIR